MSMLSSLRARLVSSVILTIALMFLVLLPAMAGSFYYSGGSSSSPYYTPPSSGNSSGSGGTYYSGSYSTKYQSNYSTYYRSNYSKYYHYTSRPSNSSPSYTPPKQNTPVPNPNPDPKPPVSNPPSTSPEPSGSLTGMEQKMVNLVNQERAKAGLQQLKVDMPLVKLARKKSQDMIDHGYFGHTSPTYGSPFDMMKNAGVDYYTAGENLAGAGSVESAHSMLMASSGHRANILNSKYNHLGVGVANGGPYGNMFTQLFVGR